MKFQQFVWTFFRAGGGGEGDSGWDGAGLIVC